jgi:D-serine deaminase-like pyridoxal phosphate-dependent protein
VVATGLDDQTLTTPALIVDRGLVEQNVNEMAARASAAGLALRPHAKTHKSVAVATLQRHAGAAGLTVGTVREAEVFAAAGFDDFLITAPPVGAWRLERLIELARRVHVRVCVDSADAVRTLDRACAEGGVGIGFLWEIDCGVGRFGTPRGTASADEIAGAARGYAHARFDGLLTFAGHVYGAATTDDLSAVAREERAALIDTADAVESRSIGVRIRSIGTTPTAHLMERAPGVTETRPGNYVFYDATQVALGVVPVDRCALTVLATVVSRPSPTRLVLDAGSKALAAEHMSSRTSGFGIVRDWPELRISRLFEEQAVVDVVGACDLLVGDRVEVIPNHACTTVNLYDEMVVVEHEEIVDVWPVDARGWARHPSGVDHRPVPTTTGRAAQQ